jgi:hypothetical protein
MSGLGHVDIKQAAIGLAEGKLDYSANESTELSFKVGQKLDILQKDDSGWWFARSQADASQCGWAPSNYLTELVCRWHLSYMWGYSGFVITA